MIWKPRLTCSCSHIPSKATKESVLGCINFTTIHAAITFTKIFFVGFKAAMPREYLCNKIVQFAVFSFVPWGNVFNQQSSPRTYGCSDDPLMFTGCSNLNRNRSAWKTHDKKVYKFDQRRLLSVLNLLFSLILFGSCTAAC